MSSERSVSRRAFLQASAAGVALAGPCLAATAEAAEPKEAKGAAVIDCHAHLAHHSSASWEEKDRKLIDAADRLGIDQLCASTLTPKRPATAEGFRECNAWLAEATERFAGRVLGYCYVNPGCGAEALDEIRRCVEDRGFIGVKLYNEHKCTDPVVAPVVELAIELKVPILHHAGHGHHAIPKQPNISDGADLAELGRRYPEARLICAHVGGGGDWEWTIKALRHAENVFLDTSGSVTDEGIVDMAVQILGADRLLFGCDMSMTAGVGKVRAARLTPAERQKILGGNMSRLLAMRA
ncbi:MAG: amidohydrolase family protein [Planctomycetes bacterium]|nr:amidohydrolase family protein [Planctomycetota bacterium]